MAAACLRPKGRFPTSCCVSQLRCVRGLAARHRGLVRRDSRNALTLANWISVFRDVDADSCWLWDDFGMSRRGARFRRAELQYENEFTRERLDEALRRVRELIPLVEEAQGDADPAVRFYRLDNELASAIGDYERCVGRRTDYVAKRRRF